MVPSGGMPLPLVRVLTLERGLERQSMHCDGG
jgi:hypothetical protein